MADCPLSPFFFRKTLIQGDLIILKHVVQLQNSSNAASFPPSNPSLDMTMLLVQYAYSQALSCSTALSVLEESLEAYLLSVAQLPHSLGDCLATSHPTPRKQSPPCAQAPPSMIESFSNARMLQSKRISLWKVYRASVHR